MVHRYHRVIWLVLCLSLLATSPVLADDMSAVTLTVSGKIVAVAPTGFTLTYVSRNQIDVSWVKGDLAVNTMVRAKYGDYPSSRTDGYLVYYGDSTIASDTTMDLEETAGKIYYRAWSEGPVGVWSNDYSEDWTQGLGVTLIGLVVLVLGLAGLSLGFHQRMFLWGSGMAAVGLAVYGLNESTASGDIYWVIGLIAAGLALLIFFLAAFSGREPGEPEVSEEDAYGEELRKMRERSFEARRKYRR